MNEEEQKVACPYCNEQISNDIERCPKCGAYFTEPNLSEFKFVSIPLFIAGEVILSAFGLPFLYSLFWVLVNYKNIRNLAKPKDIKKFNTWAFTFCIFVLLTVFFKFFVFAVIVVEILLAYRILRIIEKYTLNKYDSPVTHHEVGMLFFRTLYIVYYLDTYSVRVKDPNLRYCLDTEKWFNYLLIGVILLGLLYFLGLLSIPFIKL